MDLTGIFKWLNDLASWVGGFFTWLPKLIQALLNTEIAMVKDGFMRVAVWAAKGMLAQIDALGLPSYDVHGLIAALGTGVTDFLMASGLVDAIKVIMAVRLTMWAVGLIIPRLRSRS